MSEAVALSVVETHVRHALLRERASGLPFKAAYEAVARRMGLSPRRIRAYHHGEVAADDVRAAELIAADAAWRREMDVLHAGLSHLEELHRVEGVAGAPGDVAPHDMDAPRPAGRGEGEGVARAAHPLARLVNGRG